MCKWCSGHTRSLPLTAPGPCQFALPVVERYGIVFVYLGTRAACDVPAPYGEPPRFYSRPFAGSFETSFDAVCLNNFDRQHFGTVHRRELVAYTIERPENVGLRASFRSRIRGEAFTDRLMRAAGINEVGIEVDIHGGNLALMRNPATGVAAIITTLPVEEQSSRLFVVTFGARGGRARFAIQSWIVMRFLRQDMYALDGMRIRVDAGMLAADPVLKQWHDYFHALPRTSIARLRGRVGGPGQLAVVA
jgi:phenylpropionate dioxygenase-like ring-hydroxylating dioxygenase large terminal subunit